MKVGYKQLNNLLKIAKKTFDASKKQLKETSFSSVALHGWIAGYLSCIRDVSKNCKLSNIEKGLLNKNFNKLSDENFIKLAQEKAEF